MRRSKPNRGRSIRQFRGAASRTKRVNLANPPRGGIRL